MTSVSKRRSLEQERAKAAWASVRSEDATNKEFLLLARGAPADIQANGLGQTLAFWKAKAKNEPKHKALYGAVSGWVSGQLLLPQDADLLEWIVREASTEDYRRATAEAISFLTWLKRFAEAELAQ